MLARVSWVAFEVEYAPVDATVTWVEFDTDAPAQSTDVRGRGRKSDDDMWREHREYLDELALQADEAQDLEVIEIITVLAAVGALE